MIRRLTLLVVVGLIATGCSRDTADETEPPGESVEATQAASSADDNAPTDVSMDANDVFLDVPDGYADCGATVLTSGWPTTTAFVSEISAQCIIDAATSGTPSQHTFWGRDHTGGIEGTILRVEGPDEITSIVYGVTPDGETQSNEKTCTRLDTPDFEPPTCAD